jgi:membrane fusion protein (multidrug efflux system)
LVASAPIDAQIAVARSQAALAHARVKSAEAQLTLAKLQLSYTKLVSPEDGFVSKLSAHEGQLLSPGQPVAELVPRAAYVVANFKETQIGEMRSGQKAEVSVDAFGRTLEGQVDSLSGGTGARFSLLPPDNATGNFVKVVQRVPVRIKLLNIPSGTEMRAGLSVDVTVHVK